MTTTKKIVILGLKESGKSTFLAVLNRALAMRNSPWRVRATGPTIKTMGGLMDRIFAKGLYPEGTKEETEMAFVVEKEAGMLGLQPGAQFVMRAGDVPGEASKGVSSDDSVYHDFYQRYVSDCVGIIFILDPEEAWQKMENQHRDQSLDVYFPLFSSILAEIAEQVVEGKEPFVAFCVAKLDMNPTNDMKLRPNGPFDKNGIYDDIEDLAEKILGRGTKSLIDHSFDSDHVSWMPVSAIGYTGSGNNRMSQFVKKVVGGSEEAGIRNPKDLEPIGVAESLEWILDNIADDDEHVRVIKNRGKSFANFEKGLRRFFGL